MALSYLHLAPEQSPPSGLDLAPFRAVVVIGEPVTAKWRNLISNWLVRNGCLYMLAWGHDCSAWDDSVDYANIEDFNGGDIPGDRFVMTTWHDNQPLSEAFWFAENCASHPVVEVRQTLILHITSRDDREEMLNTYRKAVGTVGE